MKRNGIRFSIIGLGRVGSSLGEALVRRGCKCEAIVSMDGKPHSNRIRRTFPGATILPSALKLPPTFDVLLITTPDDQIAIAAEEAVSIEHFDWKGKCVFHTSGVVPVDTLSKLKNAGAHTGALHPISSFAHKYSPESAFEIFYDFYGDKSALTFARKIVRLLSSKLIVLKSERDRTMLHIASVIASNFTVIGVRSSQKMLSEFVSQRDADELLKGLLSSTMRNLSRVDGMRSLTGPLARGDEQVIAAHVQSLENYPALLQFYRSSSLLGVLALLEDENDAVRRRNLLRIKKLLEE